MAGRHSEAKLRFSVDVEKAKAKIAGLSRSVDQSLDKIKASTGKLKGAIGGTMAGLGVTAGLSLMDGISSQLEQGDLTAKLGAQLGLGEAEAARAGKIAAAAYGDNFGADLGQAGEAVRRVMQDIGEGSDQWTQDITSKVLALSQTFEQDLGGTTQAVGQMLRTGLASNAEEALDILTRGMQTGVDKAGDLNETMVEYGTLFRNMGLSGKDAMGLMSQGLQAGARDADKVADAIKEFSIRAVDGSKASAAGYKALGLDAQKMTAQIAQGGPAAKQGLDTVLDRLRSMKDPVAQSAAAVGLFGTQAEDLGKALFSMDASTAAQSLGEVAGATDKMTEALSKSPAAKIEAFKRKLELGFSGIADLIVNGDFSGKLSQAFGIEEDNPAIVGILKIRDVLINEVPPAFDKLKSVASGALTVLSNPVVQTFAASIGAIVVSLKIWSGVMAVIRGLTAAWTAAQLLLNMALTANPIGLVVLAIVALVAGLVVLYKRSETFRNAVNAVWGALKSAWGAIPGLISGIVGKVTGFFSALPGKVKAVFSKAGTWLTSAGSDLVNGFKSGISGMWGKFTGWIEAQVNKIPESVRKVLGIASPSKVFAKIGGQMWQGLKVGSKAKAKAVRAQLAKHADTLVSKAVEQAKTRRDQLKAITADLMKARADYAAKIAESLHGSGLSSLVSLDGVSAGARNDTVINGLKARLKAVKDFSAGVAELRKKGLAQGTLAQLIDAGVDQAGTMVASLRGAPAAVLKQISALDAQIASAARAMGGREADVIYGARITAARRAEATPPPVVLEVKSAGGKLDDLLVELLRKSIRAKGGNVQVVLGGRK